ncbi:MAG: hypothetical protein ACI8PZ_000606 [Myxococcota bacterium]|jgi:hypothetical protein
MLTLMFAATAAFALPPELAVSGSCPGPMDIAIRSATPDGMIAVLRGAGPGSASIPGGPCEDVVSGLSGLALVTTIRVDGSGNRTLSPTLRPEVCAASIQILDLSSCELSPVGALAGGGGECAHLSDVHTPTGSQGQWCSGDAPANYTDYGTMTFDECQCIANSTGTNWFGGVSTPFDTVWIGDHDASMATLGGGGYWASEMTVPRDGLQSCVLAQFDHRTEPSELPLEELFTDSDGRRWHFWQFSSQTHSQVISFADDVGGRVINPNSVGLVGVAAFTQPTHWCHAGAQFNGGADCNSDNLCNFVVGYFE